MTKLMQRLIDALQSNKSKQGTPFWDYELSGFGVRCCPSGSKVFVLKFRAQSGRQRWLKLF